MQAIVEVDFGTVDGIEVEGCELVGNDKEGMLSRFKVVIEPPVDNFTVCVYFEVVSVPQDGNPFCGEGDANFTGSGKVDGNVYEGNASVWLRFHG